MKDFRKYSLTSGDNNTTGYARELCPQARVPREARRESQELEEETVCT